jgi:molecular chaperone GrpE (heat shock protein)
VPAIELGKIAAILVHDLNQPALGAKLIEQANSLRTALASVGVLEQNRAANAERERDEARAEVADKAKRISELESECAAREKGADEARAEIRRRVTKDPGFAIAYALLRIADQLEDLGDSVAKIEFAMSVR